ncbi:dynein regulatory complex protein 10 [Mugil cephalus]|uniref:dynein regulatory complex protein 10 n=1 Tax=Mugil cephalus TaxID=48193 RepID=UPI001FB818B2|nr:dynein regulatory complex protein 10 [Mugil cephalus]XP_047447688.1 dynein regulatory complex protein 10 [Mugil cephalus]XP_047447689.1 dynein regulatory complex protein 10 [Mugil cephalus]
MPSKMLKTPSDALSIQKKQLSLETQRISNIMENCISKVELAATFPAVLQFNRLESGVVDTELSRVLHEHQVLRKMLEELQDLEQELDGEQEVEAGAARTRDRAQLEGDIQNAARDMFRFFRAHPDAVLCLGAELGMKSRETECTLIRGFKIFHSCMVARLLTSVDEELLVALKNKPSSFHAQDLNVILQEEKEVTRLLSQIHVEISQKNNDIANLQDTLQRRNTRDEHKSLLMDQQQKSDILKSNMKQASLQEEIVKLNSQIKSLMLENRKAEKALQEENGKVKWKIKYLIQGFDEEIEKTQGTLEVNEMGYGQEKEEVKKLEKPYSVLEMECNQIQEKRRLAEEKRKAEIRELELKTKAAIFAQAWWRGYSTRKALKNKGKNKKAKKGKGKGKKTK